MHGDWTDLHARLHRSLHQRQLLPTGEKLLIAVSGGQDSLCLLRLLIDLRSHWHWQLGIAHCNHRWRSDSDANAHHVQAIAQTYQLPFYGAIATEAQQSEAAARDWRYSVLTEIAQQHDYSAVVTGHTQSDRAETLLYNLVRGSGMDGLQALTWKRKLGDRWLVRPLLNVTRSETAEFCLAQKLPVWEDCTNFDRHYARNRIRQELLPYLQQHFNPQVDRALAQTAELLRADVEFLESAVDALWPQIVDSSRVNRRSIATAPVALQRRLFKRWLAELLPTAPNFEQIEKLLMLIDAPNRSQTDPFPGGAIARVEADWIVLER
ncbi:tRNA lysidine(34) synthetase TilS [Microcoleus sp. FACHB-1515]|uniref:tRNA lysidine(34) synthetase TilS n=1 Tax=Cyanophyceae TaxID=3028117 RepID=UPI001687901E|nr:tRNA lysidine(34) synthetase TilS [Microcoleus sp. FACHB-1515]MBD2089398.1 tRNA lysidine(34) synthetase TilS [Microcoleus sp. FACHB-1515]